VPPDRPHHPARQAEGGEEVFDVSTSLVFKQQKVVRFYDEKRNAAVI
jgi:CreA protein